MFDTIFKHAIKSSKPPPPVFLQLLLEDLQAFLYRLGLSPAPVYYNKVKHFS